MSRNNEFLFFFLARAKSFLFRRVTVNHATKSSLSFPLCSLALIHAAKFTKSVNAIQKIIYTHVAVLRKAPHSIW
jgi:hypothetical protein